MRRVKKNFSKKQFKPFALVVVLPLMGKTDLKIRLLKNKTIKNISNAIGYFLVTYVLCNSIKPGEVFVSNLGLQLLLALALFSSPVA